MNYIQIIGLIGIVYIIIAFILSVRKFRSAKGPFLYKLVLFFIFSILPMISLSLFFNEIYVVFVITEFLYSLYLFYNYVKSDLTFFGVAALFSYAEDIMIILSIYFSFYITGSLLKSITSENKGSILILSSFISLDVSFVLQAFYILRMLYPFFVSGILLFFISVILFMFPFLSGGKN